VLDTLASELIGKRTISVAVALDAMISGWPMLTT
jgi:hypothetical protein